LRRMGSKSFRFNPEFSGSSLTGTKQGEWLDQSGNPVTGPSTGTEVGADKIVPWYDSALPIECPEYKREWTHSWKIKVDKTVTRIDLNDLPLIKKFISALKGSKEFQDAEIHVLWVSHIPQNVTQETMDVKLEFTKATDPSRRVMSMCEFPGYLYTHMIFYPGHSIELHKSPIPWALTLDTTRIPVANDYQIGDMYIRLCGNETQVSHMEEERPAVMISMAPLTQRISGLTFTLPRRPSSKMIEGYVKRGVNSRKKTAKIVKLMEAGIDVEAAALIGKLDLILEKVPDDALKNHGDPLNARLIAQKTQEATKCRKKTSFGI